MYYKAQQKRSEKAARRKEKDRDDEPGDLVKKEKRERRSDRDADGEKSDRKERRNRSRSGKRRSSSKEPKKERRRRSSSPEVEKTPRSARKMNFSPSKEKQIKAHIDMILNGGDMDDMDFGGSNASNTREEETPTPEPPPPTQPQQSSTIQIKLAMEGDTHKLVSVPRDITFDDMLNEIEKKCKRRFAIAYEDEEGDRIELDDDNSLQVFFESSAGKRLKLLCTEMGIDDKVWTTFTKTFFFFFFFFFFHSHFQKTANRASNNVFIPTS